MSTDDSVTAWQRLRSLRYALALYLSERTGRNAAAPRLTPAGTLAVSAGHAADRVRELAARYRVRFEGVLGQDPALQAYEYLDFLDQGVALLGPTARPPRPVVHDIGCASFGYAAALAAFFGPLELVGVELEGFRRLKGGFRRAQIAAAHVDAVPGARFEVADYACFPGVADVITAFFPFVTPAPVLGWRLPLSVLRPSALFTRVHANLEPQGRFWMINHSAAEAATAAAFAAGAGLTRLVQMTCKPGVRERPHAPVLTVWIRGSASSPR